MNPRSKRVKKQIEDFQKDYYKDVKLLQLGSDYQSAIFAFTGPLDSPYEGYWFRILVEWPQNYPLQPLNVTLLDNIWNPYVDFTKCTICVDILKDHFSPTLTTVKIILSIVSLLGETKVDSSLKGFANPKAAIQMINNYPVFYKQARRKCELHYYEKENIYEDAQRGMGEDHLIRAEGEELNKMIKREEKYGQMKKKEEHKIQGEWWKNMNQKQKDKSETEKAKFLFLKQLLQKNKKATFQQLFGVEVKKQKDDNDFSFG